MRKKRENKRGRGETERIRWRGKDEENIYKRANEEVDGEPNLKGAPT